MAYNHILRPVPLTGMPGSDVGNPTKPQQFWVHEGSSCSVPHVGAMDRGQEHSLLLLQGQHCCSSSLTDLLGLGRVPGDGGFAPATRQGAPRAQGQQEGQWDVLRDPPWQLPWGKTARAAFKLLELSKDIQSTSWPSGKTNGTKTQQGCWALHPHKIHFLNKEYVFLRCQISEQNSLKCFETAFEKWTCPKQNHPFPQVLAPGYLFIIYYLPFHSF